ncbi:unnamed protein product [Ambrosiozyma monospora]|uniref:Unnamed protein product n=1 Tax=Ambrosiozyma monospora TaxID=43982 RepID=A0ACB5U216_AMBMO|nr:unnamed protein product [Ambrosiozyma monospora]
MLIWNMETHKVEFKLLSYSTITVAKFSKSKSNEVVGGLRNGKVCLWRLNSKSRYPTYTTVSIGGGSGTSGNGGDSIGSKIRGPGRRVVSNSGRRVLSSNGLSAANSSNSGVASGISVANKVGYHPIVGIYETTNSIMSLDSSGLLNIYSTNLITLISSQQLILPSHNHHQQQHDSMNSDSLNASSTTTKYTITSNFIDPSYLLLGLATGEVYCIKFNQLDSSPQSSPSGKSSSPGLSSGSATLSTGADSNSAAKLVFHSYQPLFPVMCIDQSLGVLLVGSLDYKS